MSNNHWFPYFQESVMMVQKFKSTSLLHFLFEHSSSLCISQMMEGFTTYPGEAKNGMRTKPSPRSEIT